MKIRVIRPLLVAVFALSACGLSLRVASPVVRAGAAHQFHGTLIIDYMTDVSHLDSAKCYDPECYPFMHAMYDRLVDYRLDGPNDVAIIPDAASAMPAVSNGGKTYTFKLRRDVRFWNGKLATSQDWKYSFERIINPTTQSGAASFWMEIVGANAFASGKAKHVSGIQTMGKFGLRITLTHPDASFLNVLSMPFGSVVDKAQIQKYGKSYDTEHPMGTGRYIFKLHNLSQKLVLVPNMHYFRGPQGHLAQIEADFSVNENTGLLRIERGQADLDGDGIPSADFVSTITDPTWKKQVFHTLQVADYYIPMNTRMKYFSNVLVRRAVNMAINKPYIVRLVNGRGIVTNTILPPNMPGHGNFNLYPYNIAKAKQLMAKAGYGHGFSTTFYTDALGEDLRVSQAIIPMLQQIGIRAALKVVNGNTLTQLVGTKGKVPITWEQWFEDFPDPNDFFEPMLSCASAVPGTFNVPWYCDPKVDKFAERLKTMTNRAQRLREYPILDKMVMQDAPIVPVYNSVYYDIHSLKLHHYFNSAVWGYVFEDYTKS